MLTDAEVPRLQNGGVALCHGCQRLVYFRGGLLNLLARELRKEAVRAKCRALRRASESRRLTQP